MPRSNRLNSRAVAVVMVVGGASGCGAGDRETFDASHSADAPSSAPDAATPDAQLPDAGPPDATSASCFAAPTYGPLTGTDQQARHFPTNNYELKMNLNADV